MQVFTDDIKNGGLTPEEKEEILVAELDLPKDEVAPAPKAKRSRAQAEQPRAEAPKRSRGEKQPEEKTEVHLDADSVNLMRQFAAEARFLDRVIDSTAVEAKHVAFPLAVAFREVGQLMTEDTADMQRLAKLRNFIERNALTLLDAVDAKLNSADDAEVKPEDAYLDDEDDADINAEIAGYGSEDNEDDTSPDEPDL